MQITNTGNDHCPKCGKLFDRASSVFEDASPLPHDLSVCIWCGTFLEFKDDLTLQILPDEVYKSLPKEEKIQLLRVSIAIKEAKAKSN